MVLLSFIRYKGRTGVFDSYLLGLLWKQLSANMSVCSQAKPDCRWCSAFAPRRSGWRRRRYRVATVMCLVFIIITVATHGHHTSIFIYDFKNHMWCSENFRKVRREINYWCKDNIFFTLYYLICINLNSRYFVMWCEVYIPVLYIFILIVRWISQKSYHWVDTRRGGRGQVATRKQFLIGYTPPPCPRSTCSV